MPGSLLEVLHVDRGAEGIDIAAKNAAREVHGQKHAVPGGRRNGMVDGVEGIRRDDVAGVDAAELVGPVNATEINVLEIVLSGGGLGDDVRDVVTVSHAHAGEAALDGVDRKSTRLNS